jgi:hypothetical protein
MTLHMWAELEPDDRVEVRRVGDQLHVAVTSRGSTTHEVVHVRAVKYAAYDLLTARLRALLQRSRDRKNL